mmetsp:Transcript_12595/g.46537  ORF Transcript_12595/g.46537 Transcript_12595/m.46537 type:complete len:292 (-) Transcript_12595:961-1836(-)
MRPVPLGLEHLLKQMSYAKAKHTGDTNVRANSRNYHQLERRSHGSCTISSRAPLRRERKTKPPSSAIARAYLGDSAVCTTALTMQTMPVAISAEVSQSMFLIWDDSIMSGNGKNTPATAGVTANMLPMQMPSTNSARASVPSQMLEWFWMYFDTSVSASITPTSIIAMLQIFAADRPLLTTVVRRLPLNKGNTRSRCSASATGVANVKSCGEASGSPSSLRAAPCAWSSRIGYGFRRPRTLGSSLPSSKSTSSLMNVSSDKLGRRRSADLISSTTNSPNAVAKEFSVGLYI